MAEKTMSLKTTAEALYNRNQVLESFEKAQNTTDPKEREKLMTFIIVGGGATGIELSGALAEMRKFILPQDYPDLDMKKMRIVLSMPALACFLPFRRSLPKRYGIIYKRKVSR